ncbi:hypothetical protein D3C85_1578010 [compost metagenome]
MQDLLSAANARLCVIDHFFQDLCSDLPFRHRLILHEFGQFIYILLCIKSDTYPFTTVSSSPAGFLVIAFHTFRNIMVDHETHVWFIDSHTESNGCHDDFHILHQEFILSLCPYFRL